MLRLLPDHQEPQGTIINTDAVPAATSYDIIVLTRSYLWRARDETVRLTCHASDPAFQYDLLS